MTHVAILTEGKLSRWVMYFLRVGHDTRRPPESVLKAYFLEWFSSIPSAVPCVSVLKKHLFPILFSILYHTFYLIYKIKFKN